MSRLALSFGLIAMIAFVLWIIMRGGQYADIFKWAMFIFAALFVIGLFLRERGAAPPPPPAA